MLIKSVGYTLCTLTVLAAASQVFATDSPPSKAPVFQASTVLKGISISAPLSDLYAKDRAWVAPIIAPAAPVAAPATPLPADPATTAPQTTSDPGNSDPVTAHPNNFTESEQSATPTTTGLPHQTDADPIDATKAAAKAAKEAMKRPSVLGTLTYLDSNGKPVTLSGVEFGVRGNSSRAADQCPFAKLTLKLPRKDRTGIFANLDEIKIGTHCGESDTPAPIWGRIQNQKEPIREALIYQVLNRMGVVTLRARPTIITYTDTSATIDPIVLPSKTITRNAFFLEGENTAAERYQARVIQATSETPPANPVFTNAQTDKVDPRNIILSALAEVLTENGDWSLKMAPTDYGAFMINWNVNILKTTTTAAMMPQVYDWDIAGWVRGPFTGQQFQTAMSRMQADPDVTQAVYADVRTEIIATKNDVYSDFAAAFAQNSNALTALDTDGQANIKNHLDAFYTFINCQDQLTGTSCY
jgi:hypothetical protein